MLEGRNREAFGRGLWAVGVGVGVGGGLSRGVARNEQSSVGVLSTAPVRTARESREILQLPAGSSNTRRITIFRSNPLQYRGNLRNRSTLDGAHGMSSALPSSKLFKKRGKRAVGAFLVCFSF